MREEKTENNLFCYWL